MNSFIAHILEVPASVRLVSAADTLHDARAVPVVYHEVGESLWKRFNGGKEGTLWCYRAIVDTFRKAGTTPLIEELDRVVSEIEYLAEGTSS